MFNKQIKEILEFLEFLIKELNVELKDREEVSKNTDKIIKEYYTKEAQGTSEKIERYNKIISDNLDMSSEKSEIINKLIELYSLKRIYNLNKIDNNLKANENINIFQ